MPIVLTILVRFSVSDGHQNNNNIFFVNNKQKQTAAAFLLLDAFKNDPTTSTQFLLAISAAQPITGSSSKQSLFSLRFSQREKFFFRLRSRFLISPGKLFCVCVSFLIVWSSIKKMAFKKVFEKKCQWTLYRNSLVHFFGWWWFSTCLCS